MNPQRVRLATLLLVLALPIGCARSNGAINKPGMTESGTTELDTTELESIQRADPATALAAALDRGDGRFLAVAGYSVMAPGLDYDVETEMEVLNKQGERIIQGTTDTPRDERHAQLINDARLYAAAYNMLLLWKLSRHTHGPTTHEPAAR